MSRDPEEVNKLTENTYKPGLRRQPGDKEPSRPVPPSPANSQP